ncbi:shikimate dehydrogenase [Sedimentibacter sp. MB31-C6]|uniref:shikimate dehydrogenase n=1 Tax=Sedimentibacter sp. MB31-C6 TaxID=3109366 RepID=UPI002DDDB4B4|nr:shikimate dehydrogenase [Sedimentibacter sp. MB36-C1]WSI03005.1 shikimate dehydrogenase [Sedimentibacter sp. MB36-C1]
MDSKFTTKRVTGQTELIGLIANPVRHSLSPTMHNESFKRLGLDYVYVAFEVDNDTLKNAVNGLKALKVRGFNVSMPNKIKIIQYLDELSDASKLTGSVNTVVNDNGTLTGHITDGIGFIKALSEEGIEVKGKKITILGSGGAGTAIMVQSALEGAKELSIFNRNIELKTNTKNIIKKLNNNTNCISTLYALEDKSKLREQIESSDILVNATGVGMKPQEDQSLITDSSILRKELVVFDCIYSPRETKLLAMAKKNGCKIINGLGMVLFQGAASFKLWTGQEMPINHIKKILF